MKNILCFGDSNTYGYIPGSGERYPSNIRWTGLLAKQLEGKANIIEEGLVGRTTIFEDSYRPYRKGTDLLPSILKNNRPLDLVIVMLGTNDCKTLYEATPQIIGEGIEQLLSQIKTYSPQSNILLVSPILLGDKVFEEGFDPEFNENSVQVAKGLKSVYQDIACKHNIDFLAASDYASYSEIDQEHMNPDGHYALSQAIGEKINSILLCKNLIA